MKLIYICSPYRAQDTETLNRNIEYAKCLTRDVLLQGDCPATPHLYMTQCLDEENEQERKTGLTAGMEILRRCDEVVVGKKYGISEGMSAEIRFAEENDIPIGYVV